MMIMIDKRVVDILFNTDQISMIMSEEHMKNLKVQLWNVANALRGKMNADEYKNYILGFIFYKYLSQKLHVFVNSELLAADGIEFGDIDLNTSEGQAMLDEIKKSCVAELGFFIHPHQLFEHLVAKGNGKIAGQDTFILEDVRRILTSIEQTSVGTGSEDDFKGLFDDVDLTSSKLGNGEHKKNEVIVEVLTHLDKIDFRLEDGRGDLLGDAYEYLIGEFASGAGKKGGEFYTPSQVSRILAQIVSTGKTRLKSVYDPTCGSGSLLLRLRDYVEVVEYYGQELNPTTFNLGRMNMILHGIHFDNFVMKRGDTLVDDEHPDLVAEAIVANPPFSASWKGDTDPILSQDDRFSQYGRLAPKGKADYAFVTHMLHHLADNGTMAVVLPHGALFRGGAEGQIREYIIDKLNYLDAVIGLPSNLFYGTSIPACILVFKKCRKEDDDVLFIDASKNFDKNKNQNALSDEHVQDIINTYQNRTEVEKYSTRASLSHIKQNDYNLNIPRYVDTFEEEAQIDIVQVAAELQRVDQELGSTNDEIARYCKELGIPTPF